MNHEIRKLQILNDLIAQTLDVIQQRAAQMPGLTPFVPTTAGLSHTPFGYPQVAFGWDPRNQWNTPVVQNQYGVQNTPWNTQPGLSHTGFDPRFGYQQPTYGINPGYNVAPQYGVNPAFGFNYPMQTPVQYGVPSYGLNHTPVDPRIQMNRQWNELNRSYVTPMMPGVLPTQIW